jgi:transposase-like protein
MLEERGVEVDHSTLNRWVVKYTPLLDRQFRGRKRPVGASWRLDETYVKVKGSGNICIGPSTRRAPRWTSC